MSWSPFVLESDAHPKQPLRSWRTPEGLGDRMRIAAFAEMQAVRAFTWASQRFTDVPKALITAWQKQIPEEQLHFDLITERMAALGIAIDERPVSDRLFRELVQFTSGKAFCLRIVAEEYRGLVAAKKLVEIVMSTDRQTADVFARIASDEVAHVAVAARFFDWVPQTP